MNLTERMNLHTKMDLTQRVSLEGQNSDSSETPKQKSHREFHWKAEILILVKRKCRNPTKSFTGKLK